MEMLSLNSNSFSGADIQKFVATVGEFVDHPHAEIQRCAHALLDLVMEFDSVQGTGQLFALAREVKFSAQNQDWFVVRFQVHLVLKCDLDEVNFYGGRSSVRG